MAAVAATVPVKQLDDITECPICVEMLTDARGLPCIHTFCLKCLQSYAKKARPGDRRPCPLCRQEFTIPEGGVEKLPKNYFVGKILDVKKLASQLAEDDVACDLCGENKGNPGRHKRKKAVVFCAECGQNMCEQCSSYHKKFKANSGHKVISLDEKITEDDLLKKFPESRCDKHSEEVIKLYCFDCKLAVCMMCYVEVHNAHKCSDVRKAADELGKQLDSDIRDLQKIDGECSRALTKLEGDRKVFATRTTETKRAIYNETDKLHDLIERYEQEMLDKLSEVKRDRNKKLNTVREETELQSTVIKTFIQYCKEMREKGTACDIAKSVNPLHRRASELRQFHPNTDYNINVKFTAHSSRGELIPTIGKLELEDDFMTLAKVKRTIAKRGSPVTGLATLDNWLFVVRWERQQIEVYDAETFEPETSFGVASLGQRPQCLAACGFYRCIYISELGVSSVHKVSWPEHNKSIKWSVAKQPNGLSVNRDHNVLVACYGANKIQEYTKDGGLVREVDLHSPLNVVQLSMGNLCVTHHGPVPGITLLRRDGTVVHRYPDEVKFATNSGRAGSTHTFTTPVGIAVDDCQRIFVADHSRNRMVVLRENGTAELLPSTVSGALSKPYSLHFDTAKKQLYIGEWDGGRVLCCGI